MTATDYPTYRTELLGTLGRMRRSLPEVMGGFNDLHRSALHDGELSTATKELIALAIGVAARCDGCIAFHVSAALRAGATRAEIEEALGVAILMGGGPTAMYAAEAFEALDQFTAAE